MTDLEESVNKLSILDDTQKHIKKLCEVERSSEKDRYKPFSTLNKTIEIQPDRKVFKNMEDCKVNEKPIKLIPLPESLNIMKEQEEKLKVR